MSPDLDPFPGGSTARLIRRIVRLGKGAARERSGAVPCSTTAGMGVDQHTVRLSVQALPASEHAVLRRLFAGMGELPGFAVYVHGSWADNTTTPFSDLDDLVIVDTAAFVNGSAKRRLRQWLNAVDMRFCRLDPLQHHGHWLISRDDLAALDEAYMPLSVLEHSICLKGPLVVEAAIHAERSRRGIRKNICVTAENIRHLYGLYARERINLYEAKCLVSALALMPAFLFQYRGLRVTKRYAIEHAEQVLGAAALCAVQWSSEVRLHWARAIQGYAYRLFALIPYGFTNPHLYRLFAQRVAPRFPKALFPALPEACVNSFLEECREQANHA